jgi:hypothetical protein
LSGRLNARGISVFYGANHQKAAIAEVRPPVGSRVAVARFEIIRKLRLLDLTALSEVRVTGSIADFGLAGRKESAVFLRSLSGRIARPAMPDDDPFEYLATQAIADYLATEASARVDGIIFSAVQAAGDAPNVVLFHKAARIEAMNVPEGTEISASTGRWTEDGWQETYEVVEKIPPLHGAVEQNEQQPESPGLATILDAMPLDLRNADWREASLRIVPESIEVHRIKQIEFVTDGFTVKRHRERSNAIVQS